jgi:hypothetical protein
MATDAGGAGVDRFPAGGRLFFAANVPKIVQGGAFPVSPGSCCLC